MKRAKKVSAILSLILIISIFLTNFGVIVKGENINTSIVKPKYVFLFIGDGMSQSQVNATQVYLGSQNSKEINLKRLGFTKFPIVGNVTTQDLTSYCPDSASTATAIANGYKTYSGVIGLKGDMKSHPENLVEKFKKNDYKVGIVTSVSLNHATPAAFYAHSTSRGNVNEIAMQMANSNVDYFGGGSINLKDGMEKEAVFNSLKNSGYKIINDKEGILNLNNNSGKIYAVSPITQDSDSIPYRIDGKKGDLELKDFVKKAIDVLENDKGFFLMVESGKIDWACHSNDAMTAIGEVIALDKAVNEAIEFYNKHPKETLILVTADHETGGLSIGNTKNKYNTNFKLLEKQKISQVALNQYIEEYKKLHKGNENINDVMPFVKDNFGLITKNDSSSNNNDYKELVLSDYEYNKLEKAFNESIKDKNNKSKSEKNKILYGSYDPFSVTVTHILNNKAGIGWTSYYHTGMPVMVYAMGNGSENFIGYYDNTDIFKKLVNLLFV
ncbi:alkaline phosphatase [Clostridium sp.]|uniref:alkaline phosphatase n=1 Tax=Clostridium sp. TaxID=1506 RepID=UPI003994729E